MPLPSEYAAQLREASDPADRQRIENALAKSARRLVVRVMRAACEPHGAADDAEDGAQELVVKLVARIVAGTVPPRYGEEDSYLQRCARNGARDILAGKGKYRHRRFAPPPREDGASIDPFGATEPPDALEQRKALLKEVLPDLHETYREVIEAHDLRGVPLKTIAQQWYRDGRAKTPTKARQNVHKAHSLGIRRLRILILQRLTEPSK